MKTRIIAAMNQKGGVGKTLATTLLAEFFSIMLKLRVLVIDADMQGNSTDQWVGMIANDAVIGGQSPPPHPDYEEGMNANECSTIADIFYGKSVLPYPTWVNGDGCGVVDVICSHPQKLEEINNMFARTDEKLDKEVHCRIRDFVIDSAVQDEYDIIMIDTGPSRNPIFRASMRAASHIVMPFKPESKDIQGIASMLQIYRQEMYSRNSNSYPIKLLGLLPNMVRRTKLHEENLSEIEKSHSNILFPQEAWLMNLTAFPERDIKNNRPRSIFELKNDSPAKMQATAMANFVAKRIGIEDLIPEETRQLAS